MKTSKTIMREPFYTMSIAGVAASAAAAAGAIALWIAGPVGAITVAVAVGIVTALLVRASGLTFPSKAKPAQAVAAKRAEEIPSDRIDTLTGLANANGLAAWLAEKAGQIELDKKGIIVLSADLDDFYQMERRYGKTITDTVLIEVAKRVAVFAGNDGIAARTGGDEFAAIATVVPNRALEVAEERAGQLVETLCRPVELGSQTIWIGGAVGGAVGSPLEGEMVLKRARAAIAIARTKGKGRFYVDKGGE